MPESNKNIIELIPDFLDYCEVQKDPSDNTQENYQRYLQKFVLWLKSKKLDDLRPHELTSGHIWDYRLYLSRHADPRTGNTLKKTTQNYYLIALRALLSFFSSKDIVWACLQTK